MQSILRVTRPLYPAFWLPSKKSLRSEYLHVNRMNFPLNARQNSRNLFPLRVRHYSSRIENNGNGQKYRIFSTVSLLAFAALSIAATVLYEVLKEKNISKELDVKPIELSKEEREKLNNTFIVIGSPQEVEVNIYRVAPQCNSDFVKVLSTQIAGMTCKPATLVIALNFTLHQQFRAVKYKDIPFNTIIPQIFCAFSDDLKMQTHLLNLWKAIETDHEKFFELSRKKN